MKKYLACFFLSILTLSSTIQGTNPLSSQEYQGEKRPSNIPKTEWDAIQKISQIMEYLKNDQGENIWEGYNLSETPLVITFPSGHLAAFNLKENSNKWTSVASSHQNIQFSENDPWGMTKVQMHPHFPVDGQFAFVFKMDLTQDSDYLPFFVLIHERFHQFQFENFAPTRKSREGYQDHLNPENLVLMQLEDRLLTEFIQTDSASMEDSAKKQGLLKDYVAVNLTRNKLLKPSSQE